MRKPDPLLIQAVREAAESFNDQLQIIVSESYALAHHSKLDKETAARVARIVRAAHAAVELSRSLLGEGNEGQNQSPPSRPA
jgi:hypothetical protein